MDAAAVFEVIDPGILTTVQDLGRTGFSRFGVPPSGALDGFSLRVGNLLAGNKEGAAGLETTIMGLKLKALKEVVIAVTGGDLSPFLNRESLEMWQTHLLVEGDVLAFNGVRAGCRAYVAIGGEIAVPRMMGSRSTFLSGRFGGLEGRALKRGDVLYREDIPTPLGRIGLRFPSGRIPPLERKVIVRVVPGPQNLHFTEAGFMAFQSSYYQVSPNCDRMGVRLEGPRIERRADVEESIISESLVPGNIQVPGDGKPLIILNESVTGGYTKIATVISTDLPKVAQLKPGDRIRFERVSIEEAHRLLREQEELLTLFRNQFPIH